MDAAGGGKSPSNHVLVKLLRDKLPFSFIGTKQDRVQQEKKANCCQKKHPTSMEPRTPGRRTPLFRSILDSGGPF